MAKLNEPHFFVPKKEYILKISRLFENIKCLFFLFIWIFFFWKLFYVFFLYFFFFFKFTKGTTKWYWGLSRPGRFHYNWANPFNFYMYIKETNDFVSLNIILIATNLQNWSIWLHSDCHADGLDYGWITRQCTRPMH